MHTRVQKLCFFRTANYGTAGENCATICEIPLLRLIVRRRCGGFYDERRATAANPQRTPRPCSKVTVSCSSKGGKRTTTIGYRAVKGPTPEVFPPLCIASSSAH